MMPETPEAAFDWKSLRRPDIERIANSIDRCGYAVLDNLVSVEDIKCAREIGDRLLDDHANKSVTKVGQDGLSGYILSKLHDELKSVFSDLFQFMTGASTTSMHVQQDARFLAGKSNNNIPPYYHFDSYVISLVLPVCLPDPSQGGEFVMFPNARPLRQGYLASALQKALYDTPFMQKRIPRRLARHHRATRVPMEVGKAYLFNGHRSLHANEPCIGDQSRFTVVFHFGNPHEASKVRRLGKTVRRSLANMMLASGLRPPRRLATSEDHEQMPRWPA